MSEAPTGVGEQDIPVEEMEAPTIDRSRSETDRGLPPPVMTDERSGRVVVLETEVKLNSRIGGAVPSEKQFSYFTLDEQTCEVLEKVATAVAMREPCLLEGETSTSKTSSISYLGMRTRNEVQRLNLNGQTDTSELVGKFVPNDGQLQVQWEELLSRPELLNEQSRTILGKANADGRGLTQIESDRIARAEGIQVPDWRWQDGMLPEAMKTGQWIILDEINLAEPQILERINSVLERNSSLTISENGGVKIGEGGQHRVHEDFRIFATMNPAEYTGRAPMSPAYKDRWTSYKYVLPPTETAYRQMMELMVYGEQPEVAIRGEQYGGGRAEPALKVLGEVPNYRGFMAKMARFQVTVEDLARNRVIGKSLKEPYVFTRRGLIGFLEFCKDKTIVDRRTGKTHGVRDLPDDITLRGIRYYYLDKLKSSDDLKKVNDQLGVLGISEDNWIQDFKGPKVEAKAAAAEVVPEQERIDSKGRDPEGYLKAVFDWIEKATGWHRRNEWPWSISSDGKLVNMQKTVERIFPGTFIDETVANVDFRAGEYGDGVTTLLDRLKGKKITPLRVSVRKDGWFLRVEEAEKAAEVPIAGQKGPETVKMWDGTKEKLTGEEAYGGYLVGDRLKLKPGQSTNKEIMDSKEIRVPGFIIVGGQKKVVIQPDVGGAFDGAPELVADMFDRVFDAIYGREIVATRREDVEGIKLGQKVRVRPGKNVIGVVAAAKELRVVGFTSNDQVITQLDGGDVVSDVSYAHKEYYEPIPEERS